MSPTLPLDALVVRGIYRLRSRNLNVGVYDGNIGFIGIREKFHSLYLFREYHVDHGGMHGTASPLEFLGLLDEAIPVRETLGSKCLVCQAPVDYVEWTADEEGNGYKGRWCHINEQQGIDDTIDHEVDPWAVPNAELFSALEAYDPPVPTQ
jgi:hypothetical protein